MALSEFERNYLARSAKTRQKRMKWWHEARFGMFVHWGLYSQLGRHEWVMNTERIPVAEYEKLADTWRVKPRPMRQWAALAKRAGMKYMVLTTKHHEGFLLWDSKLSDYTAAKRWPRRDLVREYVDACREYGLKVGFYHSLMDWHHPDGVACATDETARLRFIDYTQGCLRELCSNYGKIDIIWYDVSWPLTSPQAWDSFRMNDMIRKLQPGVIINDRSQIPEDFGTPEEHVTPAAGGRSWEACMTFNGSWGWQYCPPEDWHSARSVLGMLRTCAAGEGNLLLNIGPLPDGTVPAEAVERLTTVGKWLDRYGDIIYGKVDRVKNIRSAVGKFTRKGKKYYFWCTRWPGRELAFGALTAKLLRARLYGSGKDLPFTQTKDRLVIRGLPAQCPDKAAYIGVIEMEFRTPLAQNMGAGCVDFPGAPGGKWVSAPARKWMVSKLVPKKGDVSGARCVRLADKLAWQAVPPTAPEGFINVHDLHEDRDGIAYIANAYNVRQAGEWTVSLGHDGGVKLFVDGKSVLCEPSRVNPAQPGRSKVNVKFAKGRHEIVIAFDTSRGNGWGIFLSFEIPPAQRKGRPLFPIRMK